MLDQGAVLEMDLVEIAADARTDGDLVDRLEAADEFVVLDDFAHHRLGDRDRRQLLLLRECGPAEARRRAGLPPTGHRGRASRPIDACRPAMASFPGNCRFFILSIDVLARWT